MPETDRLLGENAGNWWELWGKGRGRVVLQEKNAGNGSNKQENWENRTELPERCWKRARKGLEMGGMCWKRGDAGGQPRWLLPPTAAEPPCPFLGGKGGAMG